MPQPPLTLDELVDTLSALAHPIRIKIVAESAHHPTCVSDLARNLGISRRSVYHHLATLTAAGIVDTRLGLGVDGRARRVVVPTAKFTVVDEQLIAGAVQRKAA